MNKIKTIRGEVYKLSCSFSVLGYEHNLKGCMFSCCVYSKLNDEVEINVFYQLFCNGEFTSLLT